MTFLDIALQCIKRGWSVFPCVPGDKNPLGGLVPNGYKNATNDEDTIRRWWKAKAEANVGIACGESDLTVVDKDHGHATREEALEWLECVTKSGKLPRTYTVLTGRRFDPKDPSKPEWALQLYYSGAIPGSGAFEVDGGGGDIQSIGDYVMAAGCIHPKSGERYEVVVDAPVAPVPEWVRELQPVRQQRGPAVTVEDAAADEWKTWLLEYMNHNKIAFRDYEKRVPNGWWLGITCPWEHRSGDGADSSTVLGILDGKIAFECSHGTCKTARRDTAVFKAEMLRLNGEFKPAPGADPIPVIGSTKAQEPEPPKDWRERYVTFEKMRDAKPTSFLIDGFLALDSITALAAPVSQRKSLIALNVAHACVTGEPLFGYFKVVNKPERVIYLCPEMGLSSFSTRLKAIGLLDYVSRSLFCQTMDDDCTKLSELNEELPCAVVIIDTATRYIQGDQNNSAEMSKFAEQIFRIKRLGATVLLLHHSIKGAANAPLSLDNAMRGSSELAAFVTSCWATKLEDPDKPYASPSLLANVKQRDFESKPLRVRSDENYRLHIIGEPGDVVEVKNQKEEQAEKVLAALLDDDPKMGINKIQEALRAAGCGKGDKWVKRKRLELIPTGVTITRG